MSTARQRSSCREGRAERGDSDRTSTSELEVNARVPMRERTQIAFLDSYEVLRELELCKRTLELRNEHLRSAERELEAARARYQDWFRCAPVAYLVIGAARVVEANDAATELLGVHAVELLGTRISRFVASEDREAFKRYRSRLLRGARSGTVELALLRPTGERVEVRLEGAALPGAARRWRTALIDLTLEKRLQRKLDEARRADAIGPVTRELAHEVGHLLMGLLGGAERVLATLGSDHPARELVAELKTAALRGGAMTEHILRRARREVLPPESTRLDAALADCRGVLARLCPEGVTLAIALAAPGLSVRLHAIDLQQVLSNLVTNACAAMPQGGAIRVATYPAPPRLQSDGRAFAVLEVSDTGAGFSVETRARLDEPHFSTKPAGTAGGVGLPIVWATVRRVGGRVRIESAPKAGTTIRVFLPIERFDPLRASREPSVLLIDDEALVRASARRSLEQAGYRVLEARSAEQALEIARGTGAVDVVVSDVGLPGMRGPEFLARLGALLPGARVLLMSADSRWALTRAGHVYPEGELLEKPFGHRELLDSVQRTFAERTLGAPQ